MTFDAANSPTKVPRNAAFYVRAVVFFGGIAAIIAGLIYVAAIWNPAIDSSPGNPRSQAMTESQREAALRPGREARRYRKELADEVVRGAMTFEQAGCEYRGGTWATQGQTCQIDDRASAKVRN